MKAWLVGCSASQRAMQASTSEALRGDPIAVRAVNPAYRVFQSPTPGGHFSER